MLGYNFTIIVYKPDLYLDNLKLKFPNYLGTAVASLDASATV